MKEYLFRDLDSRFSSREAAAVEEWISSGKAIHAMRDHPWHPVAMLAGGWGTRLENPEVREHWRTSWQRMKKDPKAFSTKKDKGPDQDLLRDHVWHVWGKNDAIQHDSYCCRSFPGSIGFPTQRKNESYNFFGSVGPEPFWQKCPRECRREGHKDDWIYC